MEKEILLQTNKDIIKKILLCLVINIILIIGLYFLPIENNFSICIYKLITGKECWNCGMTRAFLSILHFNFNQAILYNWRVIIVFPLIVSLYIIAWVKYIFKGGKKWKI